MKRVSLVQVWRKCSVLLFLLLPWASVALPNAAAQPTAAESQSRKITIDNDPIAQDAAKQAGGELLEDYGSFQLWRVSDTTAQRLSGRDSVAVHDDFDSIVLRGTTIDTTRPLPNVPSNLRQAKTDAPQFWMVQFVGPIKGEWLDNLRKSGAEVVIYMPNNAYVVWGSGEAVTQLAQMSSAGKPLQWTGAYHPAYRLDPDLAKTLQSGSRMVDVTVQLYTTAATDQSLKALEAFGGTIYKQPEQILGFTNITLQLPANQLVNVANRADVFNVEAWATPKRLDERQNQIIAGNLTGTVPSGPGYLAWLNSLGFPTDPAQYPIVDVVDDGIDNGTATPIHADFYQLGNKANTDRLIYNSNCTTDASANAVGGHGNLNAGIVGGYNNGTGAAYTDAEGFHYGLGVAPYTRLAGTKIFRNAGAYDVSACGSTDQGVVASSYNAGATMTSNSWGAGINGRYDSSSQAYDALTRDASSTTAGNQQMAHIFAAGNDGPGATTIGSPGTAKNVITVGATENVRDNGTADGCSETAANSADDIAGFSSRGPAADGRAKPDIVAPGTHVTGPASQDPGFNASGVCALPSNNYYPTGQTLYTWSSGTSHSTPAVAGTASLLYTYYRLNVGGGTTPPSPAMLKAYMLNSTRYLTGLSANDTLPSPTQGWGDVYMKQAFDSTPKQFYDQQTLFTATGQTFQKAITVADPTKPVRITLAWSDAPGATTGGAYVNNLNLEVAGSQTYKGNVFASGGSITGGTADVRNNVENVYLPAGTTGTFVINVTAANLAGNGVPGNASALDQDFALMVYNANDATDGALIAQTMTISDALPGGNGNGVAEPGEVITVQAPLKNVGGQTATAVTGTLSVASGNATVIAGTSPYPNIPVNGTQSNTTPFRIQIASNQPCAGTLVLSLSASYNSGVANRTAGSSLTVTTGTTSLGTPQTFTSSDVPKAIPDKSGTTNGAVDVSLPVATSVEIGKVTVKISATHTYDGDLAFSLVAPSTTSVSLINKRGSSGDNFTNTILDDAAATAISGGSAPFTNSYRPEAPLSVLNGQASNGTWKLHVEDTAAQDVGSVTAFAVTISELQRTCEAAPTNIRYAYLPLSSR